MAAVGPGHLPEIAGIGPGVPGGQPVILELEVELNLSRIE